MEGAMEQYNTHPRDKPLMASPRDYEEFINKSPLWHDIRMTIEDRIEILLDKLIVEKDDKELYQLQAEIRVWKEMVNLPEFLLNHAKIEQTEKEQDNA